MKTKLPLIAIIAAITMIIAGCASIDVVQTAKGHYDATNPSDVEILKTKPDKPYIELGTITVNNFAPSDIAKMYNAMRDKAASLGANAVIVTSEGMINDPWAGPRRYAYGTAIKWQ